MVSGVVRDEIPGTMLLEPAVVDEPYVFYRRLVMEAPVWQVPGTPVVIVSSFAAVTEATNRVEDFSSNLRGLLYRTEDGLPGVLPFDAGEGADALATADPPMHTVHRKAVFPELVARRMATLRPEIEDLAETHMVAALSRTPVEFMDDIANAIPIRVVSKLIGFHDEDPDELLATAFGSTAMLAATESLDEINALMERSLAVFGWMNEQLVERATDGTADGILGAVRSAVATGDLDVGAGLTIIHTLLSAGGESTTSLLGNAVYMLATIPDLQRQLRDEPTLVVPFIEEVLRLESPFRYHLRHVFHTTELCGVTIPAGSTMLLFWGAANRDPAEYERPDEVVLDRSTRRHHLAFGRGVHLCVGAPLARLEAEVILTEFLRRTTNFALDPTHPPARLRSLMVRRFNSLPLVVSRSAYLMR
jgi:cytochrome P450 family 144